MLSPRFLDIKVQLTTVTIKPGQLQMAIARGLNEGGDKVRTQVQHALKERTNVKSYRSITSRIRTVRAHAGGLQYEIVAKAAPIPIEEFPVSVTSKGVDAKTWGVDHLFKRSFSEGGTGKLRARVGTARFPIRKLYGPNLGKELVGPEVQRVFASATAEIVPPIIAKHLAKALG